MKTLRYSSLLILAVFLLNGCSGSKEAAKHPLEGEWAWSLETPQGMFNGIMAMTEVEGVLNGTFSSDAAGDATMEKIMFEENNLSFQFDSGQYGTMAVEVLLEGDTLDGNLTLLDMAASMPISLTRQVAEPASSQ